MEFIIGFLLFLLAAYISFYLPGKLTLSRVFPKLSNGEMSFFSWPVGIAIFLLVAYAAAWIHLQYILLFIIAGVVLYGLIYDKKLFHIYLGNMDKVSLGIVALGTIIFSSLTVFSYLPTKEGVQFIGTINVIDGLLHVAYIKSLLITFPPNHPDLAGVPLRGYHYFYDLMLSRMVLFYHFSPEDLYYRYFSVGISLIYGAGFYFLGNYLTKNKLSIWMILFFAYFAQSFGFVLSWFIPSITPLSELGNIYPLELILNPAIILSVGMLLGFLYLLFISKTKLSQMIFLGLLFGTIVEMKVYTGIIGIGVFFTIAALRSLYAKKIHLSSLVGIIVMTFVVLLTYVPNNLGAGGLWYSPFFAYSVYMQEPPFLSWNWEVRRLIFVEHHNVPRLIWTYAEAIGLFWFLSLGSRVIFFLGIASLFKKSFWTEEKNIAVIIMILLPILIASLFVQSISIFDTKQFFWVAGILIAIPAGSVAGGILKNNALWIKMLVVGAIVFLSVGGIWGELERFIIKPHFYDVSSQDALFFQQVTKIVPKNSSIFYLTRFDAASLVEDPFIYAPTVSAFTGRATYFEPRSGQFDLKAVIEEREKTLTDMQEAVSKCNSVEIKRLLHHANSHFLIAKKDPCLTSLAQKKLFSDTRALYIFTK